MRKLEKNIKVHILGFVYLHSASFQMDLHSDLRLICLVPKSKLFPETNTRLTQCLRAGDTTDNQPGKGSQNRGRVQSMQRLLFLEHCCQNPALDLVDTNIYSTLFF